MRNVDLQHPLYKKVFQNVFKSLQLSSLYVLYYDLDWSKDEILEYQATLQKVDEDVKSKKLTEREILEHNEQSINFDCVKENEQLPYRFKMKMCDVQYKQKMIATVGAATDSSAGIHLAFAVYTLSRYYHFDREQIMKWYNHLIEFCKLYVNGMTDKHVLQYFEQECQLHITEED